MIKIKTGAVLALAALSMAGTPALARPGRGVVHRELWPPRPYRVYGGPRVYVNPFAAFFGFGYPSIGLGLRVLPFGYLSFNFGPNLYYYYDGIYYRQVEPSHYEVVAPPIGAQVPQLPANAKPVRINGEQFFEYHGVYYKELINADGTRAYQVVGKDGVLNTSTQQQATPPPPQVGDVVVQLPDGCNTVVIGGKTYYLSADGVYYEPVNNGGTVTYRISGITGGTAK